MPVCFSSVADFLAFPRSRTSCLKLMFVFFPEVLLYSSRIASRILIASLIISRASASTIFPSVNPSTAGNGKQNKHKPYPGHMWCIFQKLEAWKSEIIMLVLAEGCLQFSPAGDLARRIDRCKQEEGAVTANPTADAYRLLFSGCLFLIVDCLHHSTRSLKFVKFFSEIANGLCIHNGSEQHLLINCPDFPALVEFSQQPRSMKCSSGLHSTHPVFS